ncbi:hypothetical protein FGO68_gene16331 [Halteria grandinella]|uniref:Uncharacterized protein n=1 Tax=Halteria grandinella TaxID=5974 RepID=A0A8J8NJL8_HALGN|nr:hypothetical protein FGO68_gene16331 [Halteria grandinella]
MSETTQQTLAIDPAKLKSRLDQATAALALLSDQHRQHFTINEQTGKLHCSLTSHDLPPQDLANYVSGNQKYKEAQAFGSFSLSFDYKEHSKFLVPHLRKKQMLYCQLTRDVVNNKRSDVEKHLNGRRFQTKLWQDWKKRVLKLKKKLVYQIKIEKRKIAAGEIRVKRALLKNRLEQLKVVTRDAILRVKK